MAARKLAVYKEAKAELIAFEKDYGSIVIDCTTPTGMKSAKDCRKEIRDARSNLEDLRKETKKPALDKCTQIDSEAKAIKERLDVLFSKFDTEIKAIENKKEIATKATLAAALAKTEELEAREAAIIAKEIELGLREPAPAPEPEVANVSADTTVDTDSSDDDASENVSVICEPHIKIAAERLHVLKLIRALVEPTDAQPTGDIDADIARIHDEVIAEIWEAVDKFK